MLNDIDIILEKQYNNVMYQVRDQLELQDWNGIWDQLWDDDMDDMDQYKFEICNSTKEQLQ